MVPEGDIAARVQVSVEDWKMVELKASNTES